MEQETTEQYREHLTNQREVLNSAIAQLKREFIGIDPVIDRISDAISSWLYFPEMQDRPVIVNLWGLTGTGKTSLIKRLTELIGYGDRYFAFDMGESTGEYFDLADSFKDIYEKCNGASFIIGLDEFQHARTINEDQEEVDKASIRAVWNLLDNGKFDVVNFPYGLNWLSRFIKRLDLTLQQGVVVENGLITNNQEIYNEIMDKENNEDNDEEEEEEKLPLKRNYFLSDDSLKSLFDLVDHLYLTENDLRSDLKKLDGDSTIDFLLELYKKAVRPKTVDCTKALVFVMGNIDEVYLMNRNFNPDINADEFHRQSLEITITQVKEALLGRFRSEQIARLGNTHIIYPAFSEESFYKIIRMELNKIKEKISQTYQLELTFDEKTEQLIYNEGTYPTQGTRPLFTTIHQIINSRLGKILNEVYSHPFPVDSIRFTVIEMDSDKDKAILQINFLKEGKTIHYITDQQALELGKLRKEKRNDQQAITAVHESGHAILSSILMKTIPDAVLSVTADSQSEGFVLARPQWNYVSKKEVIKRLAVLLGGYVAERVVFGEENVTIGSSSDLSQATQLATYVLYSCGMGKVLVTYGNENMHNSPSIIFDKGGETVNQEAKALLIEAEKLAQETLKEQENLLLQMANYLSDKRCADKNQVRDFIEKYAVGFEMNTIVNKEDAEHLFYRNHLKNRMNSFSTDKQEN